MVAFLVLLGFRLRLRPCTTDGYAAALRGGVAVGGPFG